MSIVEFILVVSYVTIIIGGAIWFINRARPFYLQFSNDPQFHKGEILVDGRGNFLKVLKVGANGRVKVKIVG